MTTFYTHSDSTVARSTHLPDGLDLSQIDSIDVHVGNQTANAIVVDSATNEIAIPFDSLTLSAWTTYTVTYELIYSNGTTDEIPREGADYLRVLA